MTTHRPSWVKTVVWVPGVYGPPISAIKKKVFGSKAMSLIPSTTMPNRPSGLMVPGPNVWYCLALQAQPMHKL